MKFPIFSSPRIVIDFDDKEFEHHIKSTTSHLKDYCSYSPLTSRTSSIAASTFSSFLRINSAIEDTSMILDKKIDEIPHLDFKTSTKVFENESNDSKPKPSFDLTSGSAILEIFIFECLEEPIILTS